MTAGSDAACLFLICFRILWHNKVTRAGRTGPFSQSEALFCRRRAANFWISPSHQVTSTWGLIDQ